jgi:hypothetical protein
MEIATMKHDPAAFEAPIPEIDTEELARQNLVKPQSVRVRLCRYGSYFGVKPRKLPNGRLLWPGNARELMRTGCV